MDKIFYGMASIPSRENYLEIVLDRLMTMSDTVGVCLNGYNHIPKFIMKYNPGKIRIVLDPTNRLTDISKFMWASSHDGYYFTVDDDILYPKDYSGCLISSLKKYGNRGIVGVHGKVWPSNGPINYRDGIQYHFKDRLDREKPCHMLGTGTVAFHTGCSRVPLSVFMGPRNADLWLAVWAKNNGIPMVSVSRPANWLTPLSVEGPTIWDDFVKSKEQKDIRSDIITSNGPWPEV